MVQVHSHGLRSSSESYFQDKLERQIGFKGEREINVCVFYFLLQAPNSSLKDKHLPTLDCFKCVEERKI